MNPGTSSWKHDQGPGDWFAFMVAGVIFATGAAFGWCLAWGVLWL